MKIAKLLIGACVGALLLSGCMTEEPIKQRASDERIELIENSSFKIELLSARTLINDDGLLTVDASTILSRTGFFRWVFCGDPKVTVWYHFDWIDAHGNICKPVQREMAALPGNIIDFHGVAPEEKYINYHLTISLKGPETEEEAAKQRDDLKKKYTEGGTARVKPVGRSRAKAIRKGAKAKKAAAKPAEKAPAPKKVQEGKLTEPFD